jgi:hypothetical protein
MTRLGRPRHVGVIRTKSGRRSRAGEGPTVDQKRDKARWLELLAPENLKKCAIYVIGPIGIEKPVKIGVANNPLHRLVHLQIGNWQELAIKGIVWFLSEHHAFIIEEAIHKQLKEFKVSGEWFNVEVDLAGRTIFDMADLLEIPPIDERTDPMLCRYV